MDLTIAKGRINWALPVRAAVGLLIVSSVLIVYTPYAEFPLTFVVMPLVCITLIVLLLVAGVRNRKRLQASAALALVAVIAISFTALKLQEPIRESLRWLLWSNRFKTELLLAPSPRRGELRHIEWQATGFAGVANDTIYLVYDPTDALASAARVGSPGRTIAFPALIFI